MPRQVRLSGLKFGGEKMNGKNNWRYPTRHLARDYLTCNNIEKRKILIDVSKRGIEEIKIFCSGAKMNVPTFQKELALANKAKCDIERKCENSIDNAITFRNVYYKAHGRTRSR